MSGCSDISFGVSPDLVFNALANPVRRRLLELLAEGPQPAGGLADHFTLSRPAVSDADGAATSETDAAPASSDNTNPRRTERFTRTPPTPSEFPLRAQPYPRPRPDATVS